MLIYYDDKGFSQGIIYLKQESIFHFINKAKANNEIIAFNADVTLPNFKESFNVELMFDIPSFKHKVNMDCLNCDKVHTGGSCCDGVPIYPFGVSTLEPLIFEGKLIPYVKKEFQTLLKTCQIQKSLDLIYDYHRQTFRLIRNAEDQIECPLRATDRCGLHKYFLDNNIPYYIGKCCTWLYPSDIIIELDKYLKPKMIYLFICCARTIDITRWGIYGYPRHCVEDNLNEKLEKQENKILNSQLICDKTKYFKSSDYKPSYEVFKEEFSYLIGEQNYNQFLDKVVI